MHFLKQETFNDVRGKPLVIDPEGPNDKLAGPHTTGSILKIIFESYDVRSGLELTIAEYRSFMKVQDVFEAGPEEGWWIFEDTDFDLLKKVCKFLATKAYRSEIARNSPAIEDVLDGATHRLPPELERAREKGKVP